MEHFARLAASVLGASEAVVASAVPLPDGTTEILVAGSHPPRVPACVPDLTGLLQRIARGDQLVAAAAGSREAAVLLGTSYEAFAGVPILDEDGALLGVLAVLDTVARSWSKRNERDLRDVAVACGTELRLRASAAQTERDRREAQQAQREAEVARERARDGVFELRWRLSRSELLLRAAELLGDTSGLDEVRRTVSELVSGDLKPAYVGLVLREEEQALRRAVNVGSGPTPLEETLPVYALSDGWPSAQAARENRIVTVADRQALIDGYDPQTVVVFDRMGLHAAVCVPLPGARRVTLGTLIVAWDEPHEIDVHERAVLSVIAGYTSLAVQRALVLDERITVARQLQEAMLTDMPSVPGLELAAMYRPAAEQDMVGGDWYDAYVIDTSPAPGVSHEQPVLAVTVGDITGHNMHAASLMGQARSMLRQADHDHREGSPLAALNALESANTALGLGLSGTLIHAHLTPAESGWTFTWTNAGHPPPLLARPGLPCRSLDAHDRLLFPGLEGRRTQNHEHLPAGSVLLLYTDGLVEEPGHGIDARIEHAARILSQAADSRTPLPQLLTRLADTLAGDRHSDDVVLVAMRVKDGA